MFEGSNVAIVTPFRKGKVDEDGVRALVDFHLENGTHGIVACGTTGEAATLSHEEQDGVIDLIIKRVDDRIPVIAGSGSNSTAEAIRRTGFAKKAGADGALVVVPYYNKPTQEGLLLHFGEIARSISIPVIVYNVPGRTVTNITAETTLQLAQIDNILGVKEASGDLVQIMKILEGKPSNFLVLSGDDSMTLPMVTMGAEGLISVASNVIPAEMTEIVNLGRNGDLEEARKLHYRYLDLMELNFVETSPIPVKYALSRMGKLEEVYRLPLCPMKKENKRTMDQELEKLGLI